MSVTTKDALALNTVLEALFFLVDREGSRVRAAGAEDRLREAAVHLASRAFAQLGAGVDAAKVTAAALRVRL
jgi:hypothetical protein